MATRRKLAHLLAIGAVRRATRIRDAGPIVDPAVDPGAARAGGPDVVPVIPGQPEAQVRDPERIDPSAQMQRPEPAAEPTAPSEVAADRLFVAVSGILDGLHRLQAEAVGIYRPEVDDLIRCRSRDVGRIQHTLDGLLDFCGDAAALALFKRLCRYYWDIDPHDTARYVYVYRDWFEPEDEAAPDGSEPAG